MPEQGQTISPNFLPLAVKYSGKKEGYDLISQSLTGLLQRPSNPSSSITGSVRVWRIIAQTHFGKLQDGVCSRLCHQHQLAAVRHQGIWLPVAWHNRGAGTPRFFRVSSNKHMAIAQSHPCSCASRLFLFILISVLSLSGIFVFLANLLLWHTFSSTALRFSASDPPLLCPTCTSFCLSTLRLPLPTLKFSWMLT